MTQNQHQAPKPADFFPAMLRIAVDLSCDLQMDQKDNDTFTAECPFHPDSLTTKKRTMTIKTQTALFHCAACGARGNPYAFAGRAWRVTANDAHILLAHNGQQVTASRPPYPPPAQAGNSKNGRLPPSANTAIMTRALDHYRKNLLTSYEAIRYLAKLAVDPHIAAQANIGFSSGHGLIEHLREQGITDQEIAETPLLNQDSSEETLAGRIIISDTDFTGGCIWMTSMGTQEGQDHSPWKYGRPALYGIPALKPDLLNLYSISPRTKTAVVTDDARLYLVLAAAGTPAALITQKRRATSDVRQRAQRYASGILRRNPRRVSLVLHDREMMARLKEALQAANPRLRIAAKSGEAITENVEPSTRDIGALLSFPRSPGHAGSNQSERAQQPPGPSSEQTSKTEAQPESEDPSPSRLEAIPGTV